MQMYGQVFDQVPQSVLPSHPIQPKYTDDCLVRDRCLATEWLIVCSG